MMNHISIMGRFVASPELRSTTNGTIVTNFTLAVDRSRKDTNGERRVDFIDCVAWKSAADFIVKYFRKGNLIAVEGELQTRTFEDKSGNKRKICEMVVEKAHFTGEKKENENQNIHQETPPQQQTDFELIDDDDDLPF